jgi:hypothetical protein
MLYTIKFISRDTRQTKKIVKKEFSDYASAGHWAVRFCLKTKDLVFSVNPKTQAV